MVGQIFDLVRFTTATIGTGTLTVGTPVLPFTTPAGAGIPDQTVIEYSIYDPASNSSEKGTGTYTVAGTTLSRTVVSAYVNGVSQGTPINLSGVAQVFIDP